MTRIIADPITHITEFVPDTTGLGQRDGYWHTTCGETALAVSLGAARGEVVTAGMIDQIAQDIVRSGWGVDPIGATTVQSLLNWCNANGVHVLDAHQEDESWSFDDVHALLLEHAGIHPIVLFLGNGAANVDVLTGEPPEARGLQYHVIAVLGMEERGYIVNDGDHPNADNDFQIYTRTSLEAARPRGMLILGMQRDGAHDAAPVPPASPSEETLLMSITAPPPGWEQVSQTDWLSPPSNPNDPNSPRYHVVHGILATMQANWIPGIVAIEAERDLGNGKYAQTFTSVEYVYDENGTSGLNWLGYEALDYRNQIAALHAALATATASVQTLSQQYDAAEAHIADLTAQLKDAQAKLASAPASPPAGPSGPLTLEELKQVLASVKLTTN